MAKKGSPLTNAQGRDQLGSSVNTHHEGPVYRRPTEARAGLDSWSPWDGVSEVVKNIALRLVRNKKMKPEDAIAQAELDLSAGQGGENKG